MMDKKIIRNIRFNVESLFLRTCRYMMAYASLNS